jgi:hypothetical protein
MIGLWTVALALASSAAVLPAAYPNGGGISAACRAMVVTIVPPS